MAQRDLVDFAGDVYDPSDEFTGGELIAKEDAIEDLKSHYRFVSQNAGDSEAARREAAARLDTIGDAIDDLLNGADLERVHFQMNGNREAAEAALDEAETDMEHARARGVRNGAETVVDILGGST